MQENIANLSPEEFEVLVSSPEAVQQRLGYAAKEKTDFDYLNPNVMKQYKINNAYLDAVYGRLYKIRGNEIKLINAQVNTLTKEIEALSQKGNLSAEDIQKRAQYQQARNELISHGRDLQEELDTFSLGSEKKSSSHKNISGWFAAKFNPDNREQNAHMAQLAEARRTSASDIEKLDYTDRMSSYAQTQNKVKSNLFSKYIDVGNYSLEGPVEMLDRGEQTTGRKLLSLIAQVGAVANLVHQFNVVSHNQGIIDSHNTHINDVNAQNTNIVGHGEVNIANAPGSAAAQEAIGKQSTLAGFNLSERHDLANNNFSFTDAYHASDIQSHQHAAEIASSVQDHIKSGDSMSAMETGVDYYNDVNSSSINDISSYVGSHPQHDYTAFNVGQSANMQDVVNFFKSTVPAEIVVNGQMVNPIEGLINNINYLPIIYGLASGITTFDIDPNGKITASSKKTQPEQKKAMFKKGIKSPKSEKDTSQAPNPVAPTSRSDAPTVDPNDGR